MPEPFSALPARLLTTREAAAFLGVANTPWRCGVVRGAIPFRIAILAVASVIASPT